MKQLSESQLSAVREAIEALAAQKIFWSGFMVTANMAQCNRCGATVNSGSYRKACKKCAQKIGLEALTALQREFGEELK